MIRLKLKLKPKKNIPISLNYKYYLAVLCSNLINNCSDNINEKLREYNLKSKGKRAELLEFTQFYCGNHEIRDTKVIFNDTVNWYLTSPIYELILYLVQELHNAGSIKVAKEEFEILSLEATEIEETSHIESNKDNFMLHLNRSYELSDKFDNYYLLLRDEMII